jgi:antitoxin component YwqK of YwqJK toxin-antitoxin module
MQRINYEDLDYDKGTYSYEREPVTGIAFDLFPEGQISCERTMLDGHEEGIRREWYPSGALLGEYSYSANSCHGLQLEWYEDGTIKKESICEFGIEIKAKEWDRAGNVTRSTEIQPSDWAYKLLNMKRSVWGDTGVSRFRLPNEENPKGQ